MPCTWCIYLWLSSSFFQKIHIADLPRVNLIITYFGIFDFLIEEHISNKIQYRQIPECIVVVIVLIVIVVIVLIVIVVIVTVFMVAPIFIQYLNNFNHSHTYNWFRQYINYSYESMIRIIYLCVSLGDHYACTYLHKVFSYEEIN